MAMKISRVKCRALTAAFWRSWSAGVFARMIVKAVTCTPTTASAVTPRTTSSSYRCDCCRCRRTRPPDSAMRRHLYALDVALGDHLPVCQPSAGELAVAIARQRIYCVERLWHLVRAEPLRA